MKILRLTTLLDYGGIESKMANLSSVQDENEWVFCAVGKGGVAENRIISRNKRVVCLTLPHTIPSPITLWKLFLFLKKEKPDVLHASGAEANFFGFFAGKLAGVPKIIVEEIGIPKHSQKARHIFQYIFRNADWAVGESQEVVKHISSQFGLRSSKTTVIYNFGLFNYDLSTIKVENKNNEFRMLMISRLEAVKNIEGVLNVVKILVKENQTNIKLTIAGSGNAESELKQKVKDLKLEDSVEFAGFINDPYPYLLTSDLYILNSHSEGFSNSLVEAMYSRTPSLSTAVGAAPEIIEDGKNGFIVPPDDEEALYEKIKAIIALPKEKLNEIGLAGHEKIVKNFSLENHVNALMKIYTHS